ncbi:MAG: hypothetical protein AB8F78_17415 [Saprospiraceae bacterium]
MKNTSDYSPAVTQPTESAAKWIKRGFELYCKGLNSKEIALLCDVSYRTVQGQMSRAGWKQARKDKQTAEADALYKAAYRKAINYLQSKGYQTPA